VALLDTILGGSFTSRLNLNLREQKGWTYGVRSSAASLRAEGAYFVRTSVEASKLGFAAKEILVELAKLSADGLSREELDKTKAQDRAELVERYETVSNTASRLGSLVALGLPPNHDVAASAKRQALTGDALAKVARDRFDPSAVTLVLVGDRKQIEPQLAEAGLAGGALPPAQEWTPEGTPAPAR
jgi:predicted Zn-dependent peptidase